MEAGQAFNFAEAVAYAGVSRQRLRKAIAAGALASTGGGKPGTLIEIQERDLIRWCREAKVILPSVRKRKRPVRIEDMQRQYEAMLEGAEEVFASMRRLAGDLLGIETRLLVLDHKICETIERMKVPAPNGERPERSMIEK